MTQVIAILARERHTPGTLGVAAQRSKGSPVRWAPRTLRSKGFPVRWVPHAYIMIMLVTRIGDTRQRAAERYERTGAAQRLRVKEKEVKKR